MFHHRYHTYAALAAAILTWGAPVWGQSIPLPTVVVDTKLKPSLANIPSTWDKVRPVAAAIDEKGNRADFTENEVLLTFPAIDDFTAKSFAARWNGRVVSVADLSKVSGMKGVKLKYPVTYLIHIDSTKADTSALSKDLRIANPLSRGKHRVSSDAALRTLAVAARENAAGLHVSLNWILQPDSISTFTTTEAPSGFVGDDGLTYTNNAFDWPYMCRTNKSSDPSCVQDIGVGAAWNALDGAGKLSNRTRVAIWDSGFDPNTDFPAGAQILPPNPGGVPVPGPGNCGGGPCPFHGTNVVMAGMAVPDNNFGAAGPGGPVADLVLVRSPSDLFSFVSTVPDYIASLESSRILNISAGIRIPASLDLFTGSLTDAFFGALRAAGILVVAAAGNDGVDIDAHDCFVVCWEAAEIVPCESDGVVCVGGLDWNSKMRHPQSNWGSDSSNPADGNTVRMFGPFGVWMFDAHRLDSSGNALPPGVYLEHGTSFSSPFVAGVAALVWAANPNLSAGQVEQILINTARTSPDNTVPRYVDAFAAVQNALGGHVPPSLIIDSPAANTVFHVDSQIFFHAIAINQDDFTNISNQIQWTSDVASDGPFPPGAVFIPNHNLAVGTHTFTATVSLNGFTKTASVTIDVIDYPVLVSIVTPSPADTFFVNDTVRLVGTATRNGSSLPAGQVSWTMTDPSHNTTSLGTGFTLTSPHLTTAGSYTFTLSAVGAAQPASVTVTVYPTPTCAPPTVTIDSPNPAPGVTFDAYLVGGTPDLPIYQLSLTLQGHATDCHGVAIPGSSLTWHQNNLAGSGMGHGNTLNATIVVRMRGTVTSPAAVPIILLAEDSQHATAQATVTIHVITH